MNRRGVLFRVDPASGREIEHATVTCPHCQRIVIVPHRAKASDLGKFCTQCAGVLCPRCSKDDRCTPFEKKIEAYERRVANERVMGLGRMG